MTQFLPQKNGSLLCTNPIEDKQAASLPVLGGLENRGFLLRLGWCACSRVRTAELFEALLSRSCLGCSYLIDVCDHGGT